jgi:hypothetical protein
MLLNIYEKVSLVLPLEQRRFFNYFDDTVHELMSMYSGFVIKKKEEYESPKTLEDECTVLPLYAQAIVDNILFMATGEQNYKVEFLRKSRDAYLKYWNDNAKGRKLKGMEW